MQWIKSLLESKRCWQRVFITLLIFCCLLNVLSIRCTNYYEWLTHTWDKERVPVFQMLAQAICGRYAKHEIKPKNIVSLWRCLVLRCLMQCTHTIICLHFFVLPFGLGFSFLLHASVIFVWAAAWLRRTNQRASVSAYRHPVRKARLILVGCTI